ncbi:transposase [bacterium]|nr:transposase [bacterium]
MVIALQSFGEYLNAHPHIHAIVSDGLFTPAGMFYVMPKLSLKWQEEIFRVKVIKMLMREGNWQKL